MENKLTITLEDVPYSNAARLLLLICAIKEESLSARPAGDTNYLLLTGIKTTFSRNYFSLEKRKPSIVPNSLWGQCSFIAS